MSRPTNVPSHIVAAWCRAGAGGHAGLEVARRALPALVALAALAACTVDERTIAPTEGGTGEMPAGSGGTAPAPVVPPGMTPDVSPAMPVDPNEGSEGNPSPEMLAAGGNGNVGAPGASSEDIAPAEPEAEEPAPMMEPAAPLTINGRVIDFYRRPMPNVPVTIAGTTVATNAQGQFSIAGVQAPYDASMTIRWTRSSQPAHAGYVYQGLTRVDPTLQALEGLPERSTDVTLFVNAIGFGQNQNLSYSFGGADSFSVNNTTDSDVVFGARWSGAETFSGTLRLLLATRGEQGFPDDPIVEYVAQQVSTFGLSDGVDTSMTLAVADPVPVASVGGSVAVAAPGQRLNAVGLRFSDGNRMPLFTDNEPPATFSYVVPNLPGATVSITAVANWPGYPYLSAHRQNVAPGQANVAIAIPNAVTPTAPLQASTITRDTPFVWSTFGQTATTFVWRLEFANTNEYMYVVTNRTTVTLPSFADGFALGPGVPAFWSVQTHGDISSVDAAAGPAGYMDSMTDPSGHEPIGPNNADGYFTESERRDFTLSN